MDCYCVFIGFVFIFDVVGRKFYICGVSRFVIVDGNVVNCDVVYIFGGKVSFFSDVYICILFVEGFVVVY